MNSYIIPELHSSIEAKIYAESLCRNTSLLTCEILFNDWIHIDNLLHDKDVYVLFCGVVYPRGVHDRRNIHNILPTIDGNKYHFPTMRIVFITHLNTLYSNIRKSTGISFRDHWYTFTYKDLVEFKEKLVNTDVFLDKFRKQLAEENIKF